MRKHYWETRHSMTPEKSLQYLREGNERFINNLSVNRNTLQLVNETAEKQFPFAAILSCSDSRIPVELVFDQGLGDIFSVRLAGNIASIYAIASLEYACKYLDSKLIVVMGHTGCGAVNGACDDLEDGNLHNILDMIRPAIHAEKTFTENRTSSNKLFTDEITRLNVLHQIMTIRSNSDILNEYINKGATKIVGAIYNIDTGKVNFFENINTSNIQHEEFEVYQR
jgi:carbonic anhydrase